MASSPKRVAVIMAGGSGERFWPLSRRAYPKQLLRLCNSDQSLLEEAVARVAPLIPLEDIFIQTSEELVEAIRAAGIGVPPENVIAEPMRRNTAGCLAYAAAYLLSRYGGAGEETAVAVLTADHDIGEAERFRETIARTMDAVIRNDVLGTIGMVPTRPATGFGYIQAESKPLDDCSPAAYAVRLFHEKPDLVTAEAYVRDKSYFWNGGMFFWKTSTFLAELDDVNKPLADATRSMADAMRGEDMDAVRKAFAAIVSEPIDTALMERSKHVIVVEATFPWDDIGSWAALERVRTQDADGNVVEGAPVVVDCKNCIVYDGSEPGTMAVGVIGVEGLVVVVRGDAVLVMPKERAEDVKRVVEALKARESGAL